MFFTKTLHRSALPKTAVGLTVCCLGLAIGLLFVLLGSSKFLHSGVVQEMTRLGIPSWARILIGVAEIGGGLLFCLPRAGMFGAAVLGAILMAAVGLYLAPSLLGPLPLPLPPLAMLVVLGLVTWARVRMEWWARYTAVLNRYANREARRALR